MSYIKREDAEQKVIEYLNDRDDAVGAENHKVFNPCIAKLIFDAVPIPTAKWVQKNLIEITCNSCGADVPQEFVECEHCPCCGIKIDGFIQLPKRTPKINAVPNMRGEE